MEFPLRALILQRSAAAALLAAALAASWVERASPFAAHARAGRRWPCWVALTDRGSAAIPRLNLAVYDPVARTLSMIHFPEATRLEGRLTVGRAYLDALRASGETEQALRAAEDLAREKTAALATESADWSSAGRIRLDAPARRDEDEPAVDAAFGLKRRLRSPRAWAALARDAFRGLLAGDRSAADLLLFSLELRRLPRKGLRPAWLPGEADAPAFLDRALGGSEPEPDSRAVTVEVLNGTSAAGLATRASKMMRLHGVDVVTSGAASRGRERTVVYDRVGDFARAARVREILGCPSAVAATRLDATRAVDVSVELGRDCADAASSRD